MQALKVRQRYGGKKISFGACLLIYFSLVLTDQLNKQSRTWSNYHKICSMTARLPHWVNLFGFEEETVFGCRPSTFCHHPLSTLIKKYGKSWKQQQSSKLFWSFAKLTPLTQAKLNIERGLRKSSLESQDSIIKSIWAVIKRNCVKQNPTIREKDNKRS